MAKFDKLSGFLTLPHPEDPKREIKFRIKSGYLDTAEESGIRWQPRRLASTEEIAMYAALRNLCVTGNAGVTDAGPVERDSAEPEQKED